MLKIKRISNSLPPTAVLVSGLFWFCSFGSTALGQDEHAPPGDPPASAALEFDDTTESKANQPISVLTHSRVTPSAAEDAAVALARGTDPATAKGVITPTENPETAGSGQGENSRIERARGARLLPPDPRRQTNSQFTEPAENPAGVNAGELGSVTAASGLPKLDASNWLLRTLGGLGIVIALLFLLRPLLRRLAGPLGSARAPSGVLEALARYPFGRGQFLVLIKLDTRILLLCQTSQGSNLITEIRDPDEVASLLHRVHDEKGESFNRKLETLLNDDPSGQPTAARTDNGGLGGLAPSSFGLGGATPPTDVIDLTGAAEAPRPWRFRMPTWPRRANAQTPTTLTATTIEVK